VSLQIPSEMRLDSRQCNGQRAYRPLSLFLKPLCVKKLCTCCFRAPLYFGVIPPADSSQHNCDCPRRECACIMVLFIVHHGCYLTRHALHNVRYKDMHQRPQNNPLPRTCVLCCNRNKRKQYPSTQKLCILMQNLSLSLFFLLFCFLIAVCKVLFFVRIFFFFIVLITFDEHVKGLPYKIHFENFKHQSCGWRNQTL